MLGPATRNNQDWFDKSDTEIQALLEKKRQLLRSHQGDSTSTVKKAAFIIKRSTVQAKLRLTRDAWLSNKVDEIQGFADRHDTKRFYDAVKTIYRPPSFVLSPLLSADGTTLLTNKYLITERWEEHFNSVLNRPASINDKAFACLSKVAVNPDLYISTSADVLKESLRA